MNFVENHNILQNKITKNEEVNKEVSSLNEKIIWGESIQFLKHIGNITIPLPSDWESQNLVRWWPRPSSHAIFKSRAQISSKWKTL